MNAIEIRPATASDTAAVRRLVQLENRHTIEGPLLLAFVDGRAVAAVTLDGRDAVADPFRPTAHIVAALREVARAANEANPTAQRRNDFAEATARVTVCP